MTCCKQTTNKSGSLHTQTSKTSWLVDLMALAKCTSSNKPTRDDFERRRLWAETILELASSNGVTLVIVPTTLRNGSDADYVAAINLLKEAGIETVLEF